MTRIIDLKSAGVLQDVRELKSKKSKESSNFDMKYAKEKLKWQKEKISVRDNPNISKEQKAAAYETIDRRQAKEKENAGIRQQEKAIYNNSIQGKASKAVSRLYDKYATTRIISRPIYKKNKMQVHISNYKQPSILAEPNQFFQGELNKEKRSLYFS